MNIAEFESQLAKIGKCLYVFSHADATQRFSEMDHDSPNYESFFGKLFRPQFFCETDSGYSYAVRDWVKEASVNFFCVEICDACDVTVCKHPKHKHEWGMTGFGHTLNEAFADVIASVKRLQGIDYSSLFDEISTLRDKVRFWNNAWHEQRILTGISFWRVPYSVGKRE